MTNQDQIIIICILASIAVPLGTLITIKTINKCLRPPVNALQRSGDIEMIDLIEPTQPQQVYYYPDVLGSYQGNIPSGRLPSFWSSIPPSYRSETLPYYQSVDGININCCLENSINLNYILWLILFFIFLLTIRKFQNMILSISLNPHSRWLQIILIIFILYYNSRDILISSALMLPLSISRISYINDLDVPAFTDFESEKIEIFSQFTVKETTDFLNKLEDNESFIVEIGFIPNIALWDIDAPQMLLSKAFLINKNSSSTTINKFIMDRLDYMVDYYYLDDTILQKESNSAVSLTYCKIKSI
jgi:hypothetical protein